MLTKDEVNYLKTIPEDKKVSISAYDPRISRIAENIIAKVKNIFPDLPVVHMGASALKISGQNDLDIYALCPVSDFDKFLPGLIKLFGNPAEKHLTYIVWKFTREKFDVEFYLSSDDSETMKRQIKVFEILKKNKKLLQEYERLKENAKEDSYRQYQQKKYEFYHRLLGEES